jgi:hypothetical protein
LGQGDFHSATRHIRAGSLPEQLIQRTGTHLLTIVIGAFVLFAPMRVLLTSLVPYKRDEGLTGAAPKGVRIPNRWHRRGIVVVAGLLIGAFAFLGEMSEGGGALPLIRLLFVASVFVGLGLAGASDRIRILGDPLGLWSRG